MPSRILRDSFVASDSIASLPYLTQLRFPRYLLAADDWGCFPWQPVALVGRLFPHLLADVTAEDVEGDLVALVRADVLREYQADGKRYVAFPNWFRHQRRPRPGAVRKTPPPAWEQVVGGVPVPVVLPRGTTRAARSGEELSEEEIARRAKEAARLRAYRARKRTEDVRAPYGDVRAPYGDVRVRSTEERTRTRTEPERTGENVGQPTVTTEPQRHGSGTCTDESVQAPYGRTRPVRGRTLQTYAYDQNSSQPTVTTETQRHVRVAHPQAQAQAQAQEKLALTCAEPLPPPVLVVPCIGSGPQEWPLTSAQVGEWRVAYPGTDVVGEVRRAVAWLKANPSRRKTYRGMEAFLTRWLSRAQDRAARVGGDLPPPQPVLRCLNKPRE